MYRKSGNKRTLQQTYATARFSHTHGTSHGHRKKKTIFTCTQQTYFLNRSWGGERGRASRGADPGPGSWAWHCSGVSSSISYDVVAGICQHSFITRVLCHVLYWQVFGAHSGGCVTSCVVLCRLVVAKCFAVCHILGHMLCWPTCLSGSTQNLVYMCVCVRY